MGIWSPIETGGGSIKVWSNSASGGAYGELQILFPMTATVSAQRTIQLTHEAALDLHYKLGALLSAGQL